MAIEDILRALDEQAEAEIADIRRVTLLKAENLRLDAKAEAERIVASALDAAAQVANAKAERRLNSARLETRRAEAEVRDEAIERVFQRAAEKLASLRSAPGYEDTFRRLLEEAAGPASGHTGSPSSSSAEPGCELRVDPADAKLAERLSGQRTLPCAVIPDLHTAGGLSITLSDGRITLDNTFESRLDRAKGFTRARIAQILMAP